VGCGQVGTTRTHNEPIYISKALHSVVPHFNNNYSRGATPPLAPKVAYRGVVAYI